MSEQVQYEDGEWSREMVEPYTPTDGDVCDDYASWRVWVSTNTPMTQQEARAEFSRWCAEHDARVLEEAAEKLRWARRTAQEGVEFNYPSLDYKRGATDATGYAEGILRARAATLREGQNSE